MADDNDIQRFSDGQTDGEECRRVLAELRREGGLGEFLLSEAATAVLDESEHGKDVRIYRIGDDGNVAACDIAAEEAAPYGE